MRMKMPMLIRNAGEDEFSHSWPFTKRRPSGVIGEVLNKNRNCATASRYYMPPLYRISEQEMPGETRECQADVDKGPSENE